jgi:hypothetical protein
MLTAACLSLPLHSTAKDRRVLSTGRRRDRPRRNLLFSQPLFQATYDLAGAHECEGKGVPEDFSLGHTSIEHKENDCASRYILCRRPHEALSEEKTRLEPIGQEIGWYIGR